MGKTKQEIETQALLALDKNSQSGDTAYSTSAGDPEHSIPNKRNTSTPASAKKRNADPPIPASYVVQPRQGPAYDYAWYHSPLEEPAVYRMSDPAAALTAYADIKVVNKRVQFDLRNMKSALLKEGLIEDSDSEDGYDKDHMLNPKRYSISITNSLIFRIRTKAIHDEYMKQDLGTTLPVNSFALLR
ncbi:hypothetical protein PENPOL_c006G09352 [Penicillium polonicum]|uniref:Uncharacterized protein n=1 Tax=Penicillium polonicum TaxID=60169 RepID=A0A1V6NK03_PENPO|nr:hypothetical protein PENPOL_c006G09352 [Penicillium polonicum]